jgi:isoamylase
MPARSSRRSTGLGRLRTVEGWEREEGVPTPLGATWVESEQAWNFALYSRHATGVTLLLYDPREPARPVYELRLDPLRNKSGRIWHGFVRRSDAPAARHYAFRVAGPFEPARGHRFDPEKILLDPFATAVHFPPGFSREAARRSGANDGRAPLAVLPEREPEVSVHPPPPRHTHDAVVYELHVRGFTTHASSGVAPARRGTFLGLVDKIPYLKELGVSVVELLPVHQFDPQEGNYWGYMTLSFFAPHQGYAINDGSAEFREMVDAFHAAGIEVWLDVVYNHTCEGDETGPTYSWRGVDNLSYYLVDPGGRYVNDSGCGNTVRCAHPAARALVLRSLRHWARAGVDGFRFDLASVLARDVQGRVQNEDAVTIGEVSALAAMLDVRVVAEAWDVGAYLLGRAYPGVEWLQWNGQFRDDVRGFVRGDPGTVGALMRRLYGSDDLFPDGPGDVYRPYQSVNFVTAHDGFCLYDLVSYHEKRNQANGHGNRDGSDGNLSWNCGWEGEDGVPAEVLTLRKRQVKNFFCLLMMSNGTPMFCAGDEFLHTQRGNNNPYNQDNETTWIDWSRLERNRDVHRFFQRLIAFRKARASIGRSRYWREDVRWYGAAGPVDLGPESRTLAYRLSGGRFAEGDLYVLINAFWEPVPFRIQEGTPRDWHRIVDTSRPSPEDVIDPAAESPLDSLRYVVEPRSVVVLGTKV